MVKVLSFLQSPEFTYFRNPSHSNFDYNRTLKMYLILAAICVGLPFITLFVYKNGYKKCLQFVKKLHFLILYVAMGARENIQDIVNRRKNKTEILARPGEVAIITGGARGIGIEVVKKLLQCDMFVIIGCRNIKVGQKACDSIKKSGVRSGDVKCYQLDVASLASIKSFANVVLENHTEIHYLINNAGIMFAPHSLTQDGFENQFATNYLGHCYLSHLLLPRLAASSQRHGKCARIVNVSSCIHYLGDINFQDLTLRDSYMDIMAYAQSKLAQVLFTKALDAKLSEHNIPVQVYAVHPGVTYTELFNSSILMKVMPMAHLLFKSSEEGARSIFHACISPKLADCGGTYITNCNLTETGGRSNSVELREQLWSVMMELLKLDNFGGLPTKSN